MLRVMMRSGWPERERLLEGLHELARSPDVAKFELGEHASLWLLRDLFVGAFQARALVWVGRDEAVLFTEEELVVMNARDCAEFDHGELFRVSARALTVCGVRALFHNAANASPRPAPLRASGELLPPR